MPDGDVDQVERQPLVAGAGVALRSVERRLRRLQLRGIGVALQAIEIALVERGDRGAALLEGGVVERWAERPVTKFERKGLAKDRTITDLLYRRV